MIGYIWPGYINEGSLIGLFEFASMMLRLRSSTETYRTLRKAILSGYLAPGERLIENELAEKMGVSRIPIREAIKKLESENLVAITPNKGATVVKMSPIEIEEAYFIVGALEGLAAKLAVSNLKNDIHKKLATLTADMAEEIKKQDYRSWLKKNIEFHRVYIDACGKPTLANLILEKREGISRYWFLACSKPGLLDACMAQHKAIMRALIQKDPEQSKKLVEQHIMSVGIEVRKYLEKILII
jgi:DNA-binding GntR family transcriptional regulator